MTHPCPTRRSSDLPPAQGAPPVSGTAALRRGQPAGNHAGGSGIAQADDRPAGCDNPQAKIREDGQLLWPGTLVEAGRWREFQQGEREPHRAERRRGVRRVRSQDLFRSALGRSEEHTSELQSLMRISYAVFRSKKENNRNK